VTTTTSSAGKFALWYYAISQAIFLLILFGGEWSPGAINVHILLIIWLLWINGSMAHASWIELKTKLLLPVYVWQFVSWATCVYLGLSVAIEQLLLVEFGLLLLLFIFTTVSGYYLKLSVYGVARVLGFK